MRQQALLATAAMATAAIPFTDLCLARELTLADWIEARESVGWRAMDSHVRGAPFQEKGATTHARKLS